MSADTLDRLTIDKTRQSTKSGRGRHTRAILVAVAVAITGIAILLIRGRTTTIEATSVSQVYPTQSFTLLNASGYVVAQRKAAVAAKTTGRLEWLGVEEGSLVRSGQVIARLENRDLQAAVRQAKEGVQSAKAVLEQSRAELTDAENSFKRQKELIKQGIVAQSDYDTAEARFKRAAAAVAAGDAGLRSSAAALDGASINLDYSLIRAPFDGVVLTKNADVGDIITPLGAAANAKAAVVTIADLASLQVEADVSESNLALVRQGQPCEISLDALPRMRFRGQLHMVVPTADRSKASVMVKVRFLDKDSRILPEMSAKVAFLEHEAGQADQQPKLALNPAAVTQSGGREGVFLIKGERVTFVPVQKGARLGDLIEVSGVKSGDRVVLRPLDRLKDGDRIALPEKK
jgi:RND family efflux transporter MFP subunit